MSHDVANALAWLTTSAYGVTIAAAPQVPMGDAQVLAVSIGSGLIGGLVSALVADVVLTPRELAKRMLASGMASGAMVAVAIVYTVSEPRLLLVAGMAMSAGLVAWPVSQMLPKLAPSILRDAIKKWLGGKSGE